MVDHIKDALPSWNNGQAKQSILDFVKRVTTPGSEDFVPAAQRIATFDNDGTLWAEQPTYFQFLFALDRVQVLASQHPEWRHQEPFAAMLKGDLEGALASGEQALIRVVTETHSGVTTEEFEKIVQDWFITARHPKLERPYTDFAYQPMRELLAHLRDTGFKTFIVSGSGIEFMRVFAEEVYGIPPHHVIGSTGKQKFEWRAGKPVLVKLPEVEFLDDKEGKPISIQKFIGRRPVAAFGNSDGDLPMMQWTAAGSGARFCLYIHHTDAEREWAYDRQATHGRLDKGLDEAQDRGWTVVDMKRDWKIIFPKEERK